MAVVTAHEFAEDVVFFLDRLKWYDFVSEDRIADFDEWGWSVVDAEVLRARSALELLRERLTIDQLAMLAAADRQWRAHPKAFGHMFRRAIAGFDPDKELDGWVMDESGRPVPIPPDHWWWRPQRW
jgi:hypothetical protein